MTDSSRTDTHRRQLTRASIELPAALTEAQLDGRACVRCGDEQSDKQLVDAWSKQGEQLVECLDGDTCASRISQLRLMGL